MTDTIRFKNYIKRLIRVFRSVVLAGEYRVEIKFVDSLDDACGDHTTWAVILADTVYLWADIKVSFKLMDPWKAGEYRYVAETICHELCHLLYDPLVRIARRDTRASGEQEIEDTTERQVQRTAYMIMEIINPRLWTPTPKERPSKEPV